MSFKDLFVAVPEWSVDEFRAYLADHHPADYQLIDVRQMKEYADQHLPGAVWLPPEELPQRLERLDKRKTTIVYCARGLRSRAVLQVMRKAGFTDVHSLRGGLQAWQGEAATGLPAVSLDYMRSAESAAQQAVLAWWLEEHARKFYEDVAETLDNPAIAAQFAELAAAENHHQATLKVIWEALSGQTAAPDFPQGLISGKTADMMEGGFHLSEVLAWAEQRSPAEILELAMSIEINAFDHYLVLQRETEDEDAKRMYELLLAEERRHLKQLAGCLEKQLHLH